jgi:hypothetical protein
MAVTEESRLREQTRSSDIPQNPSAVDGARDAVRRVHEKETS